MLYFYTSAEPAKILLIMCVWGILPLNSDQFPVGEGFGLMLYPVSVMGPFGPQTVLMPVRAPEPNTQANLIKISSQSVPTSLNPNSPFLQPGSAPVPVPAPSPAPSPASGLHTAPSESSLLQAQMSNLLPSNVPLQVYSFVQQAVISDSGSSEEGNTAQVIYMVPVSVGSIGAGVVEAGVANPDPGHLQVVASTPATATALPPDPQGQLGKTEATGTATRTDAVREKRL